MSKANLKSVKRSPVVAVHKYYFPNGEIAFEKHKCENKDYFFRGWNPEANQWEKNLNFLKSNGIEIPLYNVHLVNNSKLICICEGEKDCDALTQLGYTAVTNFDGAGKWKNSYTQALVGKTIVIFTDNDDPGGKHGQLVARKLAGHAESIKIIEFLEVPDHSGYDVSNYLETYSHEDLIKKIKEAPLLELTPEELVEQEQIEGQENSEKMGEEQLVAVYEDYRELFLHFLKNPQVDIFSEKLMTKDRRGIWQFAGEAVPRIRSEGQRKRQSGGVKYEKHWVEDHLATFEAELEPKFLVDIPEWDGKDRIHTYSRAITLEPGDITQEHLDEFLKDWLSKAMAKLYDPEIQNRIFILKGHQGAGKDTWTNNLLRGAGQFFTNMNVVQGDKDTFLHLNKGLFIRIAEFDKANRAGANTVKDMITTEDTFLRTPHGKEPKKRPVLCSFISSANVPDLLRDHSGSRRYLIFNVNKIDWDYPKSKEDSLQILAQAKDLAKNKYKASREAEQAMKAYLDIHTPDDPADDVLELYSSVMVEDLNKMPLGDIMGYRRTNQVPNYQCIEAINKVCKLLDMKSRTVRIILKANGYGWRDMNTRGYHIYHPTDIANVNKLKGETTYESSTDADDDTIPF